MREQAMGLIFRRKTFQEEELANSFHLTLKSSTIGWNSVIFFFPLLSITKGLPGWHQWLTTHLLMSLEEEMETHSNIHAWKIPWTEEPGRLQSIGCKESEITEVIQQYSYHHCTPLYLAHIRYLIYIHLNKSSLTWNKSSHFGSP